MTTIEQMKESIAAIDAQTKALADDRYRLVLAIEEAEGRPDSHEARFARAAIAGDGKAMEDLCAEHRAGFWKKFGHWPQQEIDEKARALVAARGDADGGES